MRRLLILIFMLMPLTVFAQGTMRDYPLNSNPTDNDTLLGIDEQQDAGNWAVNNFTFPGIVTYLNNQADYLRSAATFTTANEVVTATGSGRQTQRTPVQIDSAGNITNITGLGFVPGPNPEWCFEDSDNPSSDKCVSYIGGNYRTGGSGNDSGDLIFSAKIGGTKTEVGRFNSVNSEWEFPNYNILVPRDAYNSLTWLNNQTVPTKADVRDEIEQIASGGEVNDLVSVGTGEEIRVSKVGADINVKDIAAGADISVTTSANNIVIANTAPGGVTDGANVGAGAGIRRDKTGNNINLRSIVGQGRISAAVAGNNNEIDILTTAEANDLASVGTGESLRSGKSGENLQIKSLVAGANVILTPNANEIEIATTAVAGEANTASTPVAGDADLVRGKVGVDLQFKSLVGGSGIVISETADQVTISAAGGADGESNTISTTTPGDADMVATPSKVGEDLRLKSLVNGAGITLGQTADQVTVTNASPENTSASNVGGQTGEVFARETGDNLEFKTIGSSNGITVTNNTNDIQVTGVNAAADNSTKGVAAFDPNDFNSAAGVISSDYANGQKANISSPGYLSRFATTAEIEAGTLSQQAIAPDQLAASAYAKENIGFNVIDNDQAAAAGVLVAAYSVPGYLQNHKLDALICSVWDAGVGGSMTIQAIKRNGGANSNLLTAALTVTSQFYVRSTAVSAANAPLDEGDILTIEILTIHSTTPANGVHCTMELVPDI